jgi:hypothetical protein
MMVVVNNNNARFHQGTASCRSHRLAPVLNNVSPSQLIQAQSHFM